MNDLTIVQSDSLPAKYIYLIGRHEDDHVKIGCSRNPIVRLAQLQTASPSPLRLLAFFEGDQSSEAYLHKALAIRRASGEWFDDCDGRIWGFFTAPDNIKIGLLRELLEHDANECLAEAKRLDDLYGAVTSGAV